MTINLHAKLAAYSKVTSINQLPEPTANDVGGFLGVGTDGEYTIFKNVSEQRIDEMFDENINQVDAPNKSFIDSLF